MRIDELIFNEENVEHIASHNVIPEEVRQVLEGKTLFLSAKQNRVMAIGKTKLGRFLTIVLDKTKDYMYYVVAARDADKKEKRMYQEEFEGE